MPAPDGARAHTSAIPEWWAIAVSSTSAFPAVDPTRRGRSSRASWSVHGRIVEGMTDQLPLANLITLGARDFGALRDFYRRAGWPQVMDDGEFAAFRIARHRARRVSARPVGPRRETRSCTGHRGIRFTIGMQVDSTEEVDRLAERMRTAGARVTKEPIVAEFFNGRSAYLCDPEGNYFEIVWADMPDNPVVIATRRAAGP